MDNREKLELLRDTVLAAAQRSAEETEAQTDKVVKSVASKKTEKVSADKAEV